MIDLSLIMSLHTVVIAKKGPHPAFFSPGCDPFIDCDFAICLL